MKEYEQYDGLGLADLVRRREVSADELLDAALERADARNPKLNAIIHDWRDHARKAIKEGLPEGPFTGVPFLFKDLNMYMPGRVTSNGSKLFADYVPDVKSTLAERFEQAGLVVFGNTNSPEFGLTAATEPALHGPTRSPWNLDHTPGGSSGGSSSAVSAGILPMAHATDGGGSIRIPAACCGLFGMKPTRARNPVGPHTGEGWGGLSIGHAVTWTVRDSAALLDATAGPAPGDPYHAPPKTGSYLSAAMVPPKRLRIAYSTTAPSGVAVDPECIKAVENAARLLADLGHHVEDDAPVINTEETGFAQLALMAISAKLTCELRAAELGRELKEDDVEIITWRMIENARMAQADDYPKALRIVHGLGRTFAAFHERYDIWLTPTLGKPPVPIGALAMNNPDIGAYASEAMAFACFTGFMNMTGAPSMSLPLHVTQAGLPLGVMASGPVGSEEMLFSLAGEIERAQPWFATRPPSLD